MFIILIPFLGFQLVKAGRGPDLLERMHTFHKDLRLICVHAALPHDLSLPFAREGSGPNKAFVVLIFFTKIFTDAKA